uniref:Uncharacterized protein n=1 Tax=Daphnia magna TaxID=35525 RepID=A0A0P6D7D0_9CRUS
MRTEEHLNVTHVLKTIVLSYGPAFINLSATTHLHKVVYGGRVYVSPLHVHLLPLFFVCLVLRLVDRKDHVN